MRGAVFASGGTVPKIVSLVIRGVHVSLLTAGPAIGPSIQPTCGDGLFPRPSRPHLTLGLEYAQHGVLLRLVLPGVPQHGIVFRVVFSSEFQAAFHEALLEAMEEELSAVTSQDAAGWFDHCGYQTEVRYS